MKSGATTNDIQWVCNFLQTHFCIMQDATLDPVPLELSYLLYL